MLSAALTKAGASRNVALAALAELGSELAEASQTSSSDTLPRPLKRQRAG